MFVSANWPGKLEFNYVLAYLIPYIFTHLPT